MLTLGTRVKLVAFVLLAVAVLAFTAVRYANLGRYLGLSGYYTVKLELPNAGGLFPNADVTYRGVSVGRVAAMSLTPDGIVVCTHLWWAADGPAEDPFAEDPAQLAASRKRVLAIANTIVPGHGPAFEPGDATPR